MSIYNIFLGYGGISQYLINNSLRLRSSASAYLSRTPASTTNQKTFTISLWVKRGTLGSSTYNTFFYAGANSTYWFQARFGADSIQVTGTTSGGSTAIDFTTNAVYRDPSSWYHVVIAIDTTQATAANRQFIYVNGVSQTLTQNTQVAQNTSLAVNQNVIHTIGVLNYATANYFDGYLAEYNFIDGQALTPTSFGAYNTISGVWQPIRYTGTYGTNGFYLPFSNTTSTTTLGYDSSGNSNNWTCNNISLTAGSTYDAMIDSPTLSAAASNYAVMNPAVSYTHLTLPTNREV